MNRSNLRQVLECGSPLPLWKGTGACQYTVACFRPRSRNPKQGEPRSVHGTDGSLSPQGCIKLWPTRRIGSAEKERPGFTPALPTHSTMRTGAKSFPRSCASYEQLPTFAAPQTYAQSHTDDCLLRFCIVNTPTSYHGAGWLPVTSSGDSPKRNYIFDKRRFFGVRFLHHVRPI